ncbi:MAG: hypothetical protein U0930_03915 [Pirellulales bacterium]
MSKQLPASFSMSDGDGDLIAAQPDFDSQSVSIASIYPKEDLLLTVPSTESRPVLAITAIAPFQRYKQIVVTYAIHGRKGSSYVHALYREGTKVPIWEINSRNDKVCMHEDSVVTYSSENQREFEVLGASDGRVQERVKFVDDGVQRLCIVQPGIWAVARANCQLVLFSIRDKILDEVSFATQYPGWLELCLTRDPSRIVALSAENHQGMNSYLSVFRVD